jgi:hypothetical protein
VGTSTRRINKKIKEILQQKAPMDVDQVIPDIYNEVMKVKSVNRFYSSEFSIAVGAGINSINAISKGTFQQDYKFETAVNDDPITRQRIIEAILNFIGDDAFEDDSPVKTALKYALTEAVRVGGDAEEKLFLFMSEFCYCLIYLLISGQSAEALTEYFTGISATYLDEKIKSTARGIVSSSLVPHIREYIAGRMSLEALISVITEKVASLKIEL